MNGEPEKAFPETSLLFEKFRYKGKRKRRQPNASVPTFPSLDTPRRKENRKRRPLNYFEWGWERTFDVQQSDLMVRYITEETDGEKCWLVSDTRVPFVYIWFLKDGWFLLRQMLDTFLHPKMNRPLYYKKLLFKTRACPSDVMFGGRTTRVYSNNSMSLWRQLEACGVTSPWCVCCDKVEDTKKRCRHIDLVNLQTARKIVMTLDAPCKKVFPLLEAILTLTKSNKRRRALTPTDKQKVVLAQRCICGECGKLLDHMEGFEVHHIFKLSEGGSNSCVNLLAVCPSCHRIFSEKERTRPFTPIH